MAVAFDHAVIFIIIAYDYKPMLIVVSLLQIAMSPVMSTLIPTVEVLDGVRPPYCKWSKGFSTFVMFNKFYDHYVGGAPEPEKPVKPVKPEQPQPTTRLEGEATITVPVPATTMRAWEKAMEQWEKDVEKWEKDMIRYDKEWQRWNKLENKALGSLRATTTTAVQTVLEDDMTARGAWDAIQQRFGQHNAVSVWSDFKSIMDFRLSSGNPVPEIAKLELLFDQL
ncbi:hypothetical protein PQX77_020786 [Marasmius sp. AFHP31]|nr:hypothetical protein PQX77_020786 [Marasmius sp. AFHP31]